MLIFCTDAVVCWISWGHLESGVETGETDSHRFLYSPGFVFCLSIFLIFLVISSALSFRSSWLNYPQVCLLCELWSSATNTDKNMLCWFLVTTNTSSFSLSETAVQLLFNHVCSDFKHCSRCLPCVRETSIINFTHQPELKGPPFKTFTIAEARSSHQAGTAAYSAVLFSHLFRTKKQP